MVLNVHRNYKVYQGRGEGGYGGEGRGREGGTGGGEVDYIPIATVSLPE